MLRPRVLGQMSLKYSYSLLNVRWLMRNSQLPIVRVFSAFSANSLQPAPKNEKSINWTVSSQSTCVLPYRSFCKKASDSNAQKTEAEVKAEKSKNKTPFQYYHYLASLMVEMNKVFISDNKIPGSKFIFNKHEAEKIIKLVNKEPYKSMTTMIDPYIAPLMADITHPKYGLFQRALNVEHVMYVLVHTNGVDHKEKWGMTDLEYFLTTFDEEEIDNFDCRKKYEMDHAMTRIMFKFMSPMGSHCFSDNDIRSFYENMAVLARENKTFYDEHRTKQPYGVSERYVDADLGPIKRVSKENLAHFKGRDIMNNLDDLRYFVEGPYGFEIIFSWADLAVAKKLFKATHCVPIDEEHQ